MNFILSYVILAEIFVIMALSTNFLVGIIGIFSLSQAALMGVGAYTYALAAVAGIPFPLALLMAAALCAVLNVVTSLPALRLAGDYFVITSFGLQFIATALFVNWSQVTGGATGIAGIPAPRLFGVSFEEPQYFVVLSTLGMVLGALAYSLLMRSSYGRVLHAVRLNELAAGAAGRNVLKMKLGISAVSGVYAGVGGALYAIFMSYIDPSSFDIQVSMVILTMLVIGGARTLAGSLLGPFLLLMIPNVLTLVHIPPELLGPSRALAFGVLLVVFMLWRPQGIAGNDALSVAARPTSPVTGPSPLLTVDALCKNFGGVRVLEKTTFTLPEGQVTCLVGPNGAGKTTAFDCITGFLSFDAGSIRLRGDDLTGLGRGEIVQRGIARSFQNLRLFDEMSVIDNVVVCLADEAGNDPLTAIFRPFHSAALLRRKRAQALSILEQVGLVHKAEDLVTQISYGQQKLLCIARVLATDADLLLLDEPTSGLSATALDNMVKVIAGLSKSGKTLLVVEHNTRIVRDIADRIVFMHQGRVLAEGAPQDVLDRADLIEIYFGGGH